jgi:membrane-bound lytic murein transglycosylase B
LWGIAQQRHTTVQHIMQLNRLSSSLIFPGEKLKVQGAYPIQAAAFRRSTSLVRRSANTVSSSVHTLAYHTGIPEHLIPVYQQAGARYGIPWTVLAAIHRTETNFATGPVVSPAGAEGPMQFMPSTFREYAVSAPGHSGPPDINNVDDAIYTCAHMLAADGYRNNPEAALYLYDHSSAYVYTVQSLARSYAA